VAHRDYWLTGPRTEKWLPIEWLPGESERRSTAFDIARQHHVHSPRRSRQVALRIERDYQDLKQELGLGHLRGADGGIFTTT
jgi:SRSO17 transposase